MFAGILVSTQNNKILHSTVLKESVEEVEKALEELPERFQKRRKYYQVVKLSSVGSDESKKYGVILV
ncbi:hypothetical protein EW093_17060 (plasmid) [Thiospirochaeta perfilievii]|uniref:Uncharacterized protein n=1 Tax=Thiospirochaeta perfilievii TaxID=252967 RepID=A0A5C1QHF3_9SPIO|nr:hypothetical protein [Thiospirochaeta perfilievii]QEN06420.1 hypothetical protein EW093_17060 [Thiospirochaeta perfilievii]